MINEDMLDKRLKNIEVNEIDIRTIVMNNISSKKSKSPRRIILIAAMIAMTVTIVFAGVWIAINDDGTYTIETEEKEWHTGFDIDADEEIYEIYTNVYNELIEISNREGKDLIGYYLDDRLEVPFILTSKGRNYYSQSRMEAFYLNYDHEWLKIVENNIPDGYSLSGGSAQITYSDEYYSTWKEYAKKYAENGKLYYEEVDSDEIPALLRLNFSKASEGTVRRFDAMIIMVSSKLSAQSKNFDSQIVSIEGYDGVLTTLSGNYELLEVVYNGNLLILHANVKNDGTAVLIDTMKKIIKGLEDE